MRIQFAHSTKPMAIAFGVDNFLKPGDPNPQTFVQIWDTSKFDQACNEGEGGFNNTIENEIGLDYEAAHHLSMQYGFEIPINEIVEIFD